MKVFNAMDHSNRKEIQDRGSIHLNGVLWLKDATDISKLNKNTQGHELKLVVEYFDKVVSCYNLDKNLLPIINPCRNELV